MEERVPNSGEVAGSSPARGLFTISALGNFSFSLGSLNVLYWRSHRRADKLLK